MRARIHAYTYTSDSNKADDRRPDDDHYLPLFEHHQEDEDILFGAMADEVILFFMGFSF